MSEGFKERYGLLFPESWPDPLIEFKCWKHWREPEFQAGDLRDPWDCFWRGIYQVLPPHEFVRHRWSEEHVYDWTTEKFVITLGAASSGKAQPLDEVVYTPDGPRPMGDIAVGDFVLDHEGRPTRVEKTHDVGEMDEFIVRLSDGATIRCADTHLWEVTHRRMPHRRPKVLTAREINRAPCDTYSVAVTGPAEFKEQCVPMDPYLMGALLGDGSFRGKGQIRFSATEPDIVEEVRRLLYAEYELKPVGRGDYMLVKRSRVHGGANLYLRAVKSLGLADAGSRDKFIPAVYKYGSIPQRKALLSGLMDTDGTCSKGGAITFTSVSPRLVADVQFLARSLGGIASISTKKPFYRDARGEKVPGQLTYTVHLRFANPGIIFRCTRKQDRVRRSPRASRRTIISAASSGRRVPMKCITVANPRGLYLTNGCTPTHNSNDYGLLSLVDWITDPTETVTILASTTLQMLKLRSYESVVRYFQKLKRHAPFAMPGKLSKTTTAILLEDDPDTDATEKASIRGVAVAEGTEEEAVAKLRGAHLPYVRLILDELSQMRPAAMKVRTNMAIGARDFKLVGLTNPDSFTDLAMRHCIPAAEGGFKSLDPEVDETWRSQFGKVRRHDGLRSPAIMEPERRQELSFLLTQEVLDDLLKQAGGNWDDPQLWTMVRGWPPAQGKASTLLSMAEVIKHEAMKKVVWATKPQVTVMGVDPAFSEAGNRGVMQVLDIGYDNTGVLRFYLRPPRNIQINATSNQPILYQVGEQIAEYAMSVFAPGTTISMRSATLTSMGAYIGIDDSATQSVADHMLGHYGIPVRRFNARHKASELPIAQGDVQNAKERYYDQGTELWAATAALVRHGQLRGLPSAAADQLTSRPTDPDKRPIRLVSKRAKVDDGGTGKDSPDDMDAVGFSVGVARFFLNIWAGMQRIPQKYVRDGGIAGIPEKARSDLGAIARRHDLDATAYQHGTPAL